MHKKIKLITFSSKNGILSRSLLNVETNCADYFDIFVDPTGRLAVALLILPLHLLDVLCRFLKGIFKVH